MLFLGHFIKFIWIILLTSQVRWVCSGSRVSPIIKVPDSTFIALCLWSRVPYIIRVLGLGSWVSPLESRISCCGTHPSDGSRISGLGSHESQVSGLGSPEQVHTHFEEITEDSLHLISWEKSYINFISRKYYTLALNHKVYSEVFNYQLFSILINFTRKFFN